MIVVDTSIWIDHFNAKGHRLVQLLEDGLVATHPLIIGELGCGNLGKRSEILTLLELLPRTVLPQHAEVMQFVEERSLFGRGIGIVDAYVLCATALTTGSLLWTRDRRLGQMANDFKLAYVP